jgi:hypothetical protein
MSKTKAAALASVFLPLTKVDEEQRLVYGRITQEELDKSGEVMDYASSKPNFEKWSAGIEEASNGLSKGNVRVMHQNQVAGKLTEISYNDDELAIDVCAKIVDDGEWQKVLEGCYTGFSVGGKYAKRWNETVDGTLVKKYTALPQEVSIVDNPCVASAGFMLTKADGSEQEIMFKTVATDETTQEASTETVASNYQPSNDEVAAEAAEIAKTAGGNWVDHVDAAREKLIKAHVGEQNAEEAGNESDAEATADEATSSETVEKVTAPGIKQVWQASDGTSFEKKADCEAHEATLEKKDDVVEDPAAVALRNALNKVAAAVGGAEQARGIGESAVETNGEVAEDTTELTMADFERVSKAVAFIEEQSADDLQKSMWTVSSFASTLSSLAYLVSDVAALAEDEGIGSKMKGAVLVFCEAFQAYAGEEIARLLANLKMDQVESYCCAAGVDGADGLTKDVAALIELTKDATAAERERLTKFAGPVEDDSEGEGEDELTKRAENAEAERDSLRKVVEDVTPQLEALTKRLETIENTPLPKAPRNVLEKGAGADAAPTREELVDRLGKMVNEMGADGVATLLIKASQAQPQHIGFAPR